MSTFFLAFPFSQNVCHQLEKLQPNPRPGIRLIALDEFHLTLLFLGKLDESSVERVIATLRKITWPRLSISLDHTGIFPETGDPRVVWLGLASDDALVHWHRQVVGTLNAAIGFTPEDRPYSPHVTLAHLDSEVNPLSRANWQDQLESDQIVTVELTQLVLFESRWLDNVNEYQRRARFALV